MSIKCIKFIKLVSNETDLFTFIIVYDIINQETGGKFMEKGLIFNIQKFSLHDGPGIRTTVFLKGCPLRCKWCSNPESQLDKLQILYDQDTCILCKKCVDVCLHGAISYQDNKVIIDHEACVGCGDCIRSCPTRSFSSEGERKEIDDIVSFCMQDIDFYEESNGGVTISGGEGMSQPLFLEQLVHRLKKEDLHVAIETTGYIESTVFQHLAPLFDLLLFDVKHHDKDLHRIGTGVSNERILSNLQWAIQHNIEVLPRIAVIPDFNNSLEDAHHFSDLFLRIGVTKVQLLPFHQFGEKKYTLLNREYEMKNKKALYPKDLEEYLQIFVDKGIDCFI